MNWLYSDKSNEELNEMLANYTIQDEEYHDILSVLNTRGWRVL